MDVGGQVSHDVFVQGQRHVVAIGSQARRKRMKRSDVLGGGRGQNEERGNEFVHFGVLVLSSLRDLFFFEKKDTISK